MFNIITIGSATMDVFVESDDANIVSVCTKNKKSEFMSYPYGAKVEITDFDSQVGGGGVNTAVNFANLGFKTSVRIRAALWRIPPESSLGLAFRNCQRP